MVESSGLLNRRSANKRYRGFESLPLRHFKRIVDVKVRDTAAVSELLAWSQA